MLDLRSISFSYGAVQAVDDVSIRVHRGGIHGLIGPNGAGKSTCIDLVSGRKNPTSGEIVYEGQNIERRSVRWRRSQGIARSFQRISVFPELSVAHQLDLAARASKDDDVEDVVDAMGLRPYIRERCADIGYGEQRRVDIALALLGRPALLLLDEPAAGLSTEESLQLADHLADLATHRNTTVLIVEHDLEVVFRICSRLTVLEQGRVIADGDPDAVRRDARVIEAYLGSGAA